MLIGSPRISTARPGPAQSLAWPFRVNWRAGASETIEFRTDIVTSRSGREQRRAIRPKPRYSYEWSTWAKADRYRLLAGLAYGHPGRSRLVPHPTDRVRLSADAAAAGNSLPVASIPAWAQPGVYAILEGEQRELVRIAAVGASIEIDGLLLADWPARTILRRAMPGVLASTFSYRAETNDLASFSVRFEADPGDSYEQGAGTPGVSFDSREVFTWKPNWTDPVEIGIDSGRESIDYGFGLISHSYPLRAPVATTKASFLATSWADAAAMKEFFIRQQGARGEFWLPSFTRDLIPRQNVQTNKIVTEGSTDYYAYKDEPINRAVVLRETDGTLHYNRIIEVTLNGSGHSSFTVQNLWPEVFQLSQVGSISFMSLARFFGDAVTIDWQTSEVASLALNFKRLEYQGAE